MQKSDSPSTQVCVAFRAACKHFDNQASFEAIDQMAWVRTEELAKSHKHVLDEIGEDFTHAAAFHIIANIVLEKSVFEALHKLAERLVLAFEKEELK